MDEGKIADQAAVFQGLANEARLKILLAISERFLRTGPVSFSEAMEAAGFDDSSRFAYHLAELDRFLDEHDGEYVPTEIARELWPLVAGGRLLDHDADVEARTVGTCVVCGGPLTATINYGFKVICEACDSWLVYFQAPPSVTEGADMRQLAHEFDATIRKKLSLLIDQRCPECGGVTAIRLREPRPDTYVRSSLAVAVDVACLNCFEGYGELSVGQLLLGHPTVRAYCREHDIDLEARPQWEYAWVQTDLGTEIRSTEPWEVAVYASVDGCRLVAILEGDGTVAHLDHLPVSPDRTATRVGNSPSEVGE